MKMCILYLHNCLVSQLVTGPILQQQSDILWLVTKMHLLKLECVC